MNIVRLPFFHWSLMMVSLSLVQKMLNRRWSGHIGANVTVGVLRRMLGPGQMHFMQIEENSSTDVSISGQMTEVFQEGLKSNLETLDIICR